MFFNEKCIRTENLANSTQGRAQDCWSAYIFFSQIHYFMVKNTTFFAEWWSGPTSADQQEQNTVYCDLADDLTETGAAIV
jgi:hypothetical protein